MCLKILLQSGSTFLCWEVWWQMHGSNWSRDAFKQKAPVKCVLVSCPSHFGWYIWWVEVGKKIEKILCNLNADFTPLAALDSGIITPLAALDSGIKACLKTILICLYSWIVEMIIYWLKWFVFLFKKNAVRLTRISRSFCYFLSKLVLI